MYKAGRLPSWTSEALPWKIPLNLTEPLWRYQKPKWALDPRICLDSRPDVVIEARLGLPVRREHSVRRAEASDGHSINESIEEEVRRSAGPT